MQECGIVITKNLECVGKKAESVMDQCGKLEFDVLIDRQPMKTQWQISWCHENVTAITLTNVFWTH